MAQLSPDSILAHYRIVSKIGEGGMGEVYLAQDTRLDRKVALKILPADVAAHRDRMERFVREAKAAASLNHPHIAHIYEISESDGTNFIAMEFIDGETLRQKIHRDHAPLADLLKYLQQAAEGLAKAHAAGIVHRDLKPDNIMVTADGYAKVLDFGLAKLIETQQHRGSGSEIATAVMPQHSLPGTVLGTVGYMSPEQAQGKVAEIDHRSDIFSFGCILFEAATRQKPFHGLTPIDSLHKLVHAPTPQIKEFNPTAPDDLQRVVRRCLAKEPDKRFQSIRDVAIELEEIRGELKVDVDPELSRSTATSITEVTRVDGGLSTASVTAISTRSSVSSAEYIAGEIKRHKFGVVTALVILLVFVSGGLFSLYRFVQQRQKPLPENTTPLGANMKLQRLNVNGIISNPTISPDGKFVSYVIHDGESQSLKLRVVAEDSVVQVVAPTKNFIGDQTFSRDGTSIYYLMRDQKTPNGTLYKVGVFGGETRRIITNTNSTITFSPDGNRVAFLRNDEATSGEDHLIIANTDGTGEKILAARKTDSWFETGGRPGWSPDGKTIACPGGGYREGAKRDFVIAVDVETGKQLELTRRKWSSTADLAWLSDGSGLVLMAMDQGSDVFQFWQVSYPSGEVRRITNDLSSYNGFAMTPDAAVLATVKVDFTANIWLLPTGGTKEAKQVSFGKSEGLGGLAWSMDDKIVYSSSAGGNRDIWMMNKDGSGQRQLTTGGSDNSNAAVSPDGRYIVFISNRAGLPNVWRMDPQGGSLKQLTSGTEDYTPQISPDGQSIVFTSWRSSKAALWKMPFDGGPAIQLSDKFLTGPSLSPDGKLIAAFERLDGPDARLELVLLPLEGGAPAKSFALSAANPQYKVHWATDGRALTYVAGPGRLNIWRQSIDGGPPKQLTEFKENDVLQHSWSPDGKWLAVVRGSSKNDLVLISDFR